MPFSFSSLVGFLFFLVKSLRVISFYIYLSSFGCAGSVFLCGLFSNCSEQGLLFSCDAQASRRDELSWQSAGSRRAGFSSCSMQA